MRLWAIGSFAGALGLIAAGTPPIFAVFGALTCIGMATTARLILIGEP